MNIITQNIVGPSREASKSLPASDKRGGSAAIYGRSTMHTITLTPHGMLHNRDKYAKLWFRQFGTLEGFEARMLEILIPSLYCDKTTRKNNP